MSTLVIADDIVGGKTGSIPYQAKSSVTDMLPIGSVGQILAVSNLYVGPTWIDPPVDQTTNMWLNI